MSEMHLKMVSKREEGFVKLIFTQVALLEGQLCTIVYPEEQPPSPLRMREFVGLTKWFYRLIFRLSSLKPGFQLQSSAINRHSIAFHPCINRRQAEMVLICASDDFPDGGGIFRIPREDFDEIRKQLEKLEIGPLMGF